MTGFEFLRVYASYCEEEIPLADNPKKKKRTVGWWVRRGNAVEGMDTALARLGADGWQLVQVVPGSVPNSSGNQDMYGGSIFQRLTEGGGQEVRSFYFFFQRPRN